MGQALAQRLVTAMAPAARPLPQLPALAAAMAAALAAGRHRRLNLLNYGQRQQSWY